jgi:hypothetical protein
MKGRFLVETKFKDIVFSVGAITFFAYASAYSFYEGKFSYWGIPQELLKIDINTVLRYIREDLLLIGFLIVISVLETICFPWEKVKKLQDYSIIIASTVFLTVMELVLIGINKKLLIFTIGIPSIALCWLLVIVANEKKSKSIKYDIENKKICIKIMVLLYFLYVILNISYLFGERKAREQVDYYVVKNEKNQIVLQELEEYFIVESYDKDKKEFKKSFKIVDKKDLEFELIHFDE